MEETGKTLNINHALKWGGIKGLVAVILNLLLFIISADLLQNGVVGFVLLIINIGIIIYAGINHRSEVGGGYMSYGVAFRHAFIVMAIAGLIMSIYSILLYNVIAPDFREMMTEKQMEGAMSGAGGNTEMLDTFNYIFSNMFKPLGIIVLYFLSLIGYAIGAAILGLITNKKNEEDF